LLKGCVVSDVSLFIRIGIPPLFRSLAEQGDIQQVGFACIDSVDLFFGYMGGDDFILYCVGVDTVVYFFEGSLEVPFEIETLILFVFKSLKLFYQIKFKHRADS
jgi:hypothetical protein